jgi:hypothetical protein
VYELPNFATIQAGLPTNGFFPVGGNENTNGEPTCAAATAADFQSAAQPYAESVHDQWFGRTAVFFASPNSFKNASEETFELDPRFAADPSGVLWP